MTEIRRRMDTVVLPPITEEYSLPVAAVLADEIRRPQLLTELLRDEASSRIALYLPVEWLPTPTQQDYYEAYQEAWWGLLSEVDYRADFVDGDIGELDDDRPRPMVSKAAHLIPSLIDTSVLHAQDVAYLRDVARGEIIERSLADTLDLGTLAVASLEDDPILRRYVMNADITPARAKWLYESGRERIARDVARTVDMPTAERLVGTADTLQRQIALRAIARLGRQGSDISDKLSWMQSLRSDDDAMVRRQAEVSLRHLYHAGVIPLDVIGERGILRLSGELSQNIRFMEAEILEARRMIEQMTATNELAAVLYPIVILGGSRLKGYGGEGSDVDMAVLVRPGARVPRERLADMFGGELPKLLQVEIAETGLRVDPDHSHLLYNAVWIGDVREAQALRHELSRGYDDPSDQRVALGRLEQDALRYRLMHKGYERHFAVEADDVALPSGGIDRNSTYWDPGYRRLATQIFAERVRLPRIK